ncbi:hypothetical protein C8Q72DRAFT_888604 [Fomitopsis betulina]|nr:hypothetical protein C8Q72DRAFT_888604 [Fomitopsis betulina]
MSTQVYGEQAHQAPAATARKDWRELYAQKYAKRNNPRYLKVGRIHEDVDDAAQIWRMKTETVTSNVDNAREHGRVTTTDATPTSPHRASPPAVAYSGAWNAQPTSCWAWEGDIWGGNNTRKAVEMGHDYLTYPVGDISADIVNGPCERDVVLATAGTKATIGDDKAVSRFAFAGGMHQRTQSGSTASSSSLKTEQSTD